MTKTALPVNDGPGDLRAGFSRLDITPPLSIPYLSYMPRQTAFEGVHDPLFARAMVVGNDETTLVIIAADALGFSSDVLGSGRDFIAEVRARVEACTGIVGDHVMLTASHAHSTPQTTHIARLLDFTDAGPWLERLIDQLALAALLAQQRLRPAQLKGAAGQVSGVASSRRIVGDDGKLYRLANPPARIRRDTRDEQAPVLLLQSTEGHGEWCGVVSNFACHPTTVQVQPLVSGDFPAYACALVERELPAEACLFLQGAAGDINPRRNTTTFADVRIYGQILGAEILQQAALLRAPDAPPMSTILRAGRRLIHLPTRPLPDRAPWAELLASAGSRIANAERDDMRRQAEVDFRRAREVVRLIDLGSDDVACEIQVLRLGDALVVGVSGELFCQFGLDLKAASPSPITVVAAYANGYVGYLASREDYDLGGYETSLGPWTRLGPGATERLVDEAQSLMHEVWTG